jgi:purine-binding chemotaxis protein CheW
VGSKVCAVPLGQVLETMRPLPIEPLADMPSFVRGLALIRGRPTPVVDARQLLGSAAQQPAGRFVTLRCGPVEARRVAALAVDAVLDIIALEPTSLTELPELLGDTPSDVVGALGSLDRELLLVLKQTALLPDELWRKLEAPEAT